MALATSPELGTRRVLVPHAQVVSLVVLEQQVEHGLEVGRVLDEVDGGALRSGSGPRGVGH